MIRKTKREYYSVLIERSNGDSTKMWSYIKELLPRTRDTTISNLEINGCSVSDPKAISGVFNSFFIDIGANLAASIPPAPREPIDFLHDFKPLLNCNFHFKEITADDVARLLNDLPSDKATGLDNISAKLLKMSAPAISRSLAHVFNKSLRTGSFPNKLKNARVTAIYKKGTRSDPGNYRPISILPVLSKILERIVHRQLTEYCSQNKLITDAQSGFRKGHSTQTSLLRLTENVLDLVENGSTVGMIALDLKKAFDTVNHKILLQKMDYYGVRGPELAWFSDYLSNRHQQALINGHISDSRTIDTGVPQGSILGPLLFIMYVNDLSASLQSSSVNMYADDTAFYFGHPDTENCK